MEETGDEYDQARDQQRDRDRWRRKYSEQTLWWLLLYTTLLISPSWIETLRKLTRERCECDTHWFVRVERVREALRWSVGWYTREKWLLEMEKDGK
jgi:hypothetical protein